MMEAILSRLERVSKNGDGWTARCPAHEDRSPSLSVGYGDDGRILLHCFAGCSFEDITRSLGVNSVDLRPRPRWHDDKPTTWATNRSNGRNGGEARAERVRALYESAISDDGTISAYLRHRGLSGNVPAALKFVPALTYFDNGNDTGTYPAMVAAIIDADGATVGVHKTYLAEGGVGKADVQAPRKAESIHSGALSGGAIRLAEAGDVLAVAEGIETSLAVMEATETRVWATTSTSLMQSLVVPEHVREVQIWADNDGDDGAGQRAAERLAERLHAEGRTVRIILPRDERTDWLDVLKADGPQALRYAQTAAEPWQPSAADEHETASERLTHFTDLGNARRLVKQHGDDIRYSHPQKRWYVWNGRIWKPDDTAEIERRAKQTVLSIYDEARRIAEDKDDERQKLVKHALRSESRFRLSAMIELANSELPIPILPEQLDSYPKLLTVANGTLDLRTGTLREHRRADYITKMVPIHYDAAATAPRWERFLLEVMGGDKELVSYLQRVVGYCLTGDTSEQVLFLLHGTGSNGKTVFLEVLRALLEPFAVTTEPDLLMTRRNDAHPTGLAALWGARIAIAVESDEDRRLNETLVKWLTGGDKLTARFMRQDFFEFTPTHKLFLATNHRPIIRGTDHAIWRRIHMIPFSVTFHEPNGRNEPKQDPRLLDKLRAELSGILAWAVRGTVEWQRDGLRPPSQVKAATNKYRADMDIIGRFLEERCLFAPNAMIGATPLYEAYVEWCKANGERWEKQRSFGGRMTDRGYKSRPGRGNRQVYDGIGLLPVEDVSRTG